MNPAEIEAALVRLGPEDRALVELSVIREVADDDIASLLGVDADYVRTRREEALALLGMRLGARSYDQLKEILKDLRELPDRRWRDTGSSVVTRAAQGTGSRRSSEPELAAEPVAPEPEPEPEPEPPRELGRLPDDPGPEDIAAAGSRATRPLVLIGVLVVVLLVAVVLAVGGGDDEPKQARPAPTGADNGTGGTKTPPAKRAKPSRRAKLTPPAGTGQGSGSASITGSGSSAQLDLTVRGLAGPANGGYVVWLYNTVFDSRSLSGSLKRTFRVRKKLPADYRKFRFIDVSSEPADGNRNHSGLSVLRVPISALGS